jgi:hypothetical protein
LSEQPQWDHARLRADSLLAAKNGAYLPKGVESLVRFLAKLSIERKRFRAPVPAGGAPRILCQADTDEYIEMNGFELTPYPGFP